MLCACITYQSGIGIRRYPIDFNRRCLCFYVYNCNCHIWKSQSVNHINICLLNLTTKHYSHVGLDRTWPNISNCAHPDKSSSSHSCWSRRHLHTRHTLRQKCKSSPVQMAQLLHGAPAPNSWPNLPRIRSRRLSSFFNHSGAAAFSSSIILMSPNRHRNSPPIFHKSLVYR